MAELSVTPELAVPPQAAKQTKFLSRLGPGLITGSADDDPSGIATYSQVGAQFGMGMLWTMLFSYPLMAAIQEICARLGRVTGAGIAANLRNHYPRPLLYAVVVMLCLANIFNLGADISAMGAAAQLIFAGNINVYALFFGILSLCLQINLPYRRHVKYLKWLSLALFAYVATAFVVHVPWAQAFRSMVIPSIAWNTDYWMALVAVLGTTISPYLFFWQTSEEAEEVRINGGESPLKRKPWQAFQQFRRIALDTRVGMALSNLIALFIILTTAATIHAAGHTGTIGSAAEAARALQPLAGRFAFSLFALGIIGTGLLAVPVLAGSSGYAVAETFRWQASLERKPREAPKFYFVIAAATVIGLSLNLIGMNPIRALFWSAVVNGVVAAPLMTMLMLMSANRRIVRQFVLPVHLRVLGWTATVIMLIVSLFFLTNLFSQYLWHRP
jgi:NRAMP (natural resistance-associated macrophage protein)-like metal ion transporter